jgi:uncharacterized protein with FMN-binding domain
MFRKMILAAVIVTFVTIALIGGVKAASDQDSLTDSQRERSIEADVARWIAKGEYYASLDTDKSFDPAETVAAETARWIAKGEYYARLAEAEGEPIKDANASR